jgi:hypothetical protein
MNEPQPARPIFVLHLRPLPTCTDPIKALRFLLKRALRSHGLKCVSCEEVRAPNSNTTTEATRCS